MKIHQNLFLFLLPLILIVQGCAKEKHEYVWVKIVSGKAVEIDSASKKRPRYNSEKSHWEKVLTEPFAVSAECSYLRLEKREEYRIVTTVVVQITEPIKFAETGSSLGRMRSRFLAPIVKAMTYNAMTEFENNNAKQKELFGGAYASSYIKKYLLALADEKTDSTLSRGLRIYGATLDVKSIEIKKM